MAKLSGYWRLIRADKPVGIYLLLWPCLWALWIAAEGVPELHLLIVFVLGVVVMRSAGCVINDYADRKVDGAVARTSDRPIVTGEVTAKQAIGLFVVLLLVALALVLTLSWQTVLMSFGALLLTTLYPFMKRYTYFPQVVLGAAFGWSIPMAFVASEQPLSWIVWVLYLANLCWTVAYDTQYAMADKEDDIKVGIKSTAIFFGNYDKIIIGLLQLFSLFLLLLVGLSLAFSWPFFVACGISLGLFGYQQWLIKSRDRDLCFKSFLHNNYVGMILTLGIVCNYWL